MNSGLAQVWPLRSKTAIVFAFLVIALAACDERSLPTAPDTSPAAITIEDVTTIATRRGPAEEAFTYRVLLALRETAGVGATISQVTATVAEISGATTVNQLSPIEAFGTTRITANRTLTSAGIRLMGPLPTVSQITVRVAFTDDNGNSGSAQTSAGVRLDLNGNWRGPLNIPTMPAADWSVGRATLIQSGDSLTGELVSRDGLRFPLVNGTVARSWAPTVSIGGMPMGSGGCAVVLWMTEFEFRDGRVERVSGNKGGRCPGTVGGSFGELQHSS